MHLVVAFFVSFEGLKKRYVGHGHLEAASQNTNKGREREEDMPTQGLPPLTKTNGDTRTSTEFIAQKQDGGKQKTSEGIPSG